MKIDIVFKSVPDVFISCKLVPQYFWFNQILPLSISDHHKIKIKRQKMDLWLMAYKCWECLIPLFDILTQWFSFRLHNKSYIDDSRICVGCRETLVYPLLTHIPVMIFSTCFYLLSICILTGKPEALNTRYYYYSGLLFRPKKKYGSKN